MINYNSLVHGDCLDVMKEIDDESIDLILCDLPYGTVDCAWDSIIPFEYLWQQYARIIKHNSAIVLTSSQPFTTKLISSKFDLFKYCWVWQKTRPANYVLAQKHPLKYHEDICVFGFGRLNYFPQMEIGNKPYIKRQLESYDKDKAILHDTRKAGTISSSDGSRYPSSIIKISNDNHNSLHPTQKPVQLFEYLIKTYTKENDLVLDNCAGSCTTAIACMNTNRNYICIEKELEYIEISNERIANHIISKPNISERERYFDL